VQGMEPALYAPEDLLGDDKRKQQMQSYRNPHPQEPEDPDVEQPSSSWFTHWFGLSDARTAPATSDLKHQAPLHKPPFVRPAPIHPSRSLRGHRDLQFLDVVTATTILDCE